MQLGEWLRDRLWRADDWRQSLATALDEVRASGDAQRALEVGRALEHVEPDRRKALDAYLVACRGGHSAGAVSAARRVAREIRALGTYATLATDDWTAALAHLDADQPAPAQAALARARAARPGDERYASLLGALDGTTRDVRALCTRWIDRAVAADDPAHALIAARLARRAAPDEHARILRLALDRWPADDEVALLVEDLLIARGDPDELLTFYKLRLGTRQGAHAWADELRAASTRLCVRGVAPGLGLRLARRGLQHAYDAGLVDVPGHLASWAMLVDHARAVRASRELMPLAVTALRLPMSDIDRVWLARFGLEAAWRDAGDGEAARPYAAILAELAPDHPDLREYVHDQVQVDIAIDDDVVDPDIADLALSLVFLDQHDVAHAAVEQTTAAVAAPAPVPPARSPSVTAQAKTLVEVAQGAVAAAEEVAVISSSPPQPGAISIPSAAVSALRRIGARMRVPTTPPVPAGGKNRAARVVVPVDVTVELDDGRRVEAMVRDISTTGVFLLLDAHLGLGTDVTLELRLPAEDALATTRHRAWGRVVRQGNGGYGLNFLDPDPELTDALAAVCARLGAP